MKRRASQQLVPGGQNEIEDREKELSENEDLDSTSQDTCNSERKKFKAKRSTATEVKVEETSENFLKLLADLKDPDIVRKTNERNAKLEEQEIENVTPRKVITVVQNEFEKVFTAQVKLKVSGICLGKGELQVLKFKEGEKNLIVFRNCIQKVLFSGVVFKYSKVQVLGNCKEKHEGKADLGVRVLRQPEMKICSLALCGAENEVMELKRILDLVLETFNISEQGGENHSEIKDQDKENTNETRQVSEPDHKPQGDSS